MLENVILKRPWTIIAAWLIIAVASAPLAAGLNNVVKTGEEQLLPSTAESVRAGEAMRSLSNGTMGGGGEGGYLLVVEGVPASLEDYYRLRDWYAGLKSSYPNSNLQSWIDVVNTVEANVSKTVESGLEESLAGVKGLVDVAKAYNATLAGVNRTALLVESVDRVYSAYYSAGVLLSAGVPVAIGTGQALNLSCNTLLPAVARAYYDVMRAEALLENLTNAYTTPPLTPEGVAIVVSASNVSGAWPLEPALVYSVYNATLAAGGPSAFNNSFAAALAGTLVWRMLQESGVPAESKPYYDAAASVWEALVGEGDDRLLVSSASNLARGQLALLQRILSLEGEAKPVLAYRVGGIVAAGLPKIAEPVVNATVQAVVEANCTVTSEVLVGGLEALLESRGVPACAAAVIARDVYYGNYTRGEALSLAAETVKAKTGVPEETLAEVAEAVDRYDPPAAGNLTAPLKYGVAAILTVKTANATLTPESAAWLLSSQSLEDAAYNAATIIVNATGGEPAVRLLGALRVRGLLAASVDSILDAAPSILASLAGREGGSASEAEALLVEAVKVYKGEEALGEAASRLVNETLAQVYPGILEALRGVLVESDEEGFIIMLRVPNGTLDDRVASAEAIKAAVEDGLRGLGYDATILLGGSEYTSYEVGNAARSDIERSDRLSMVFVVVILALVMESIAAVFLPFIGIGFGLAASMAVAYLLARGGVIDVSTFSRTIMFTTGLGLGIDYAAYVSRKYRDAVSSGLPPREAAVEAYRRSLRPVAAGAITAMIGFGSMILAWDFPFVSSIGSNVPLTVLAVMVASVTFIPALLAYLGEREWFWWPRHPVESSNRRPRLAGLGGSIAGKPLAPLFIALILAASAVYVMSGFTGSYDLAVNLPRDSEARLALDYVNTRYDPGVLYPVYIVASPGKAGGVAGAVKGLQCVSTANVLDGYQGRVVRVVLSVYPLSKEGVDCVSEIRRVAHGVDEGSLVGGSPAVNLDLVELVNDRFYHRIYPVAITLMFLTFLVAYGGVVTALSAIASVVAAAYAGSALTVLLYEHLLGSSVAWYLPVIVFTAILGVGMDYNSFYIARARDECSRECSRESVARSIAHGSPTVLGLATIMAGAYVGLALAASPGLSAMGAALVFGVLLAGVNASLILTPPLIALLGRASWWPRAPQGG